jgi:hypothetical protein
LKYGEGCGLNYIVIYAAENLMLLAGFKSQVQT